MESKFTPASGTHVYCMKDNNIVKESTNGVNCCHGGLKYAIWAVTVFALLLAASNIYLHFELNNLKKVELQNLRDTKTKSNNLYSNVAVVDNSKQPNLINIKKRYLPQNSRSRRRRHWRGHRNPSSHRQQIRQEIKHLKAAILKQVVHLRGSQEVLSQQTRNPVHGVGGCGHSGCFRWSNPDYIFDTNFVYIKDRALNKVVGITITSPGVYIVYSQVGVSGPMQRTGPSIGYETVRTDSSGTTTVLMRTFITQDERGSSYIGRQHMHAHDSLNQFGVFKLNCNDTVIVRQDTPAGNNPPDFMFDEEQSFFGVIQINPTNGSLYGNNDCNSL